MIRKIIDNVPIEFSMMVHICSHLGSGTFGIPSLVPTWTTRSVANSLSSLEFLHKKLSHVDNTYYANPTATKKDENAELLCSRHLETPSHAEREEHDCKIASHVYRIREPQAEHCTLLLVRLCTDTLIVFCFLVVAYEDRSHGGANERLYDSDE
jgi:hypothetical protein